MATSAVSPRLLALYISDPDAVSTDFTDQTLVDSGDHLTYQIAWANRGWDINETPTIYVDAAPVSSGFTINYATGAVTFTASQEGSTITATGKRYATTQLIGLTTSKLSVSNKVIDVSAMEDSWEESIKGKGDWSVSTDMWWYCDTDVPTQDLLDRIGDRELWVQFYPYNAAASKVRFVGRAILETQDVDGAQNDAMKQMITIKGDGPLEKETYSA